jgi:hypothetical protein
VLRHVDALRRVQLAQPVLQLTVALLRAQFPLDQLVGVAEAVHHVHREHDVVERRRRRLPAADAGRRLRCLDHTSAQL